ncbi:6762_t:CDS:2 [Cetraspora pellucida]|uniref:6762_t:CDS:1 n=1 Tax=Cetraspora pellucida TaxID=1433469 RepID=A0A9N9C212_9GLOM|nr:6762_t:CDS:2 [Cetraspora pellucida]
MPVFAISQLCSNILNTIQEELRNNNRNNDLFISENLQLSEISQMTKVMTKDINNNSDIFNKENWLNIVKNWTNTLDDKDNFNQNESSSNEILEFELGEYITYLANNLLANEIYWIYSMIL